MTSGGGRAAPCRAPAVLIGAGLLLASVNAYLLTRAALDHAQSAQLWLIGSLGGAEGRQVLPAAAMGALLLSASDLVAISLPTAGPLPVGVVTGALGGVYPAWLLGRGRRR
ncbi:hypothetical protein ACWEIM_29050 [Streptomyces sp. NPDC004778]